MVIESGITIYFKVSYRSTLAARLSTVGDLPNPLLLRTILLCLSFFSLLHLSAQFTVTGTIGDLLSRDPLIGVNVQLLPTEGTDMIAGNVTDANGQFTLRAPAGNYRLIVSYVGYKKQSRSVTITDADVNLRPIRLRVDPTQLQEVEVTGQAVRAEQLGDTTSFNADAYKTNPEASAEDLIEKMPGVVVENGQVEAQGEQVKQVLVDGRPFFDNDVNAALRNLPAEMIQKIQIFDQESEQAQFTGFSDGETTKTINIVTRSGMSNGQFGKVYAGYGTDERYKAGGSVNIFNGDQRISLIGQLNNINQQNFSAEDLVGVLGSGGRSRRGGRGGGTRGGGGSSSGDFLVDQQNGIATTQAFGLNFSDKWGEKLEVNASYFLNHSDNIAATDLSRIFPTEEGLLPSYLEASESRSNNTNHRFNARLEYKINDNHSLLFRPRLSYQANDGNELLDGASLLGDFTESETFNDFDSQLRGLNVSNSLLYRVRLNKPRRTLSLNLSGSYRQNTGDNQQDYRFETFGTPPAPLDSLRQIGDLDEGGYGYGASLNFTEPLGKMGMLMFNYRYSFQQNDTEIETFDFNEVSADYDLLNLLQSNRFQSDYVTHETGVGYNFRTPIGSIMARMNVQWAELDNDQEFPFESQVNQNFFSLQPMLMARLGKRGTGNSLRFLYRSSAQSPSAQQLQEVIDNSNPILLSVGNPALEQSINHRIFLRWNKVSAEKTKVFYGLLSANFQQNYVGSATYLRETDAPIFDRIDLARGSQLTQSVNLDGQYNLRALMTYGLPLAALKSNLNASIESSLTRTPSLLNDELNEANSLTYGAGLTLSSNISENVDFTLSTRSRFNRTTNSLREDFDNQFFNQRTRLRLNLIFGPDLVFNTGLTHQYYDAFSDDFDQNYLLWNLSLGKQIFANRRGKISLDVFDALEQNNALEQNVTGTYVENLRSLVLQRYVMLSFTYRLRHFGKAPDTNPDEERRERMRRMMGF